MITLQNNTVIEAPQGLLTVHGDSSAAFVVYNASPEIRNEKVQEPRAGNVVLHIPKGTQFSYRVPRETTAYLQVKFENAPPQWFSASAKGEVKELLAGKDNFISL